MLPCQKLHPLGVLQLTYQDLISKVSGVLLSTKDPTCTPLSRGHWIGQYGGQLLLCDHSSAEPGLHHRKRSCARLPPQHSALTRDHQTENGDGRRPGIWKDTFTSPEFILETLPPSFPQAAWWHREPICFLWRRRGHGNLKL